MRTCANTHGAANRLIELDDAANTWGVNPGDEYQLQPGAGNGSITTLSVEITIDDGLTWTDVDTFTSAHNRAAWTLRRIALDDYLAETIRIRFRAVQGAAWTSDVWLVDDVRIGERELLPELEFPFVDDVEAGADNWEPGGQWAVVEDAANSPTHAWSLNPDDADQRQTDFALELAGLVTIPEDAVRPELSWYESLNIASDTTVTVEITADDGLTWTAAATFTSAHNRAAWTLRRIPLDDYLTETIRIRFRAVQGTAWTSDVWLIDDVRIGERQQLPALDYPFMDDMESGLLYWAAEGQWDVVADDAHSPTQVLSLNPAAEYQRDTAFSVELDGSVYIPETASAPELHYYDHFDIASDTTLTVQITSDDGLNWTGLASFTSAYNRPDWVLRQLSLAGYQGETIRIRFRAEQGSAWYNDVWLIDDVVIDERQPLPVLAFPFEDNLESGGDNWLPDGQWTVVADAGYGGSAALSLNPGAEYQRSTDFAIELNGSITIPVEAVRPELSYHDLLTVASDTTLSVEITLDDGLNWTEEASFTSAYNRSDWTLRRVALDGYQGETIRIRLRAVQGSSWTSDVWIVDDVRIGEREALPDLGFPFSDDMESEDNWEPDGQWILVDDDAHSATHAWSMNPAEDYQRDTDFALELAGQIVIASDAVDPELTWYDKIEAAADTTLQIELSTNAGLDWIVLQSFSAADNTADWTLREVSLTDYIGETISIRYRAIQGSSWSVDSWLIDDVHVAVSAPEPTATPTPTGTATATATATTTSTPTTTPTPSSTPEPSATGEATQTPTQTATAAATSTLTLTPSPTPEYTPTPTPTPTLTPTPTPTALAANRSMSSVALAAIVLQPVAPIPAPAAQAGEVEIRTIDYSYDPLYRLTAADYDDGSYFHYSYDAVGNRLSEGTLEGSSAYTYDAANRLTDVDGVAYSWDANGNMLSDGSSSYSYNPANRLVGVSQGSDVYSYAYNGLGDRLQQVVNGDATSYTLDLNTGLTQVLADGSNAYLYGLGRIGEQQPKGWMYHLPDALGSVRQLSGPDAALTLAQSYEPFGDVLASAGNGESVFQYAGEARDGTGLTFLRARYYAPWQGRFSTRDTWEGDLNWPQSLNKWAYASANPIRYTDPTGHYTYDRMKAAQYAMDWDHKSYIDPEYDYTFQAENMKWDLQCTLFASSVLHHGGVEDERHDPIAAGGESDIFPPYWDIDVLMAGGWEVKGYEANSSWFNTDSFYAFVTLEVGRRVLRYNNPPQYNDKLRYGRNAPVDKSWENMLIAHRGLIQEGDLVFYGDGDIDRDGDGKTWDHVAIVVGWGVPTSFPIKPDTDVSASGIEPDSEMLRWIESLQCRGDFYRLAFPLMPVRPLVVERSGKINYTSWRSLDNTSTASPVIDIVHINGH